MGPEKGPVGGIEFDRLVVRVLYAHDWQARSSDAPRDDGFRDDASHKGYGPTLAKFQTVDATMVARLEDV